LNFGTPTYVYTGYLGKYYRNLLFGARIYISPNTGGATQSYNAIARYYFKGADDYLGLSLGSGISPDDKTVSVNYSNKNRFSSRQATLIFNHSIAKRNIVALKAGWLNQEFESGVSGNQVNVSCGYQRRF
jgi:YaiO family outer membrane protein